MDVLAEETTLVENPEPCHTNRRMTGKGVLGCYQMRIYTSLKIS